MNEAVATADVSVAESEVAVTRAAVLDARAQLTLETTILDHYTLYAPCDAVVVTRHKELATEIQNATPG